MRRTDKCELRGMKRELEDLISRKLVLLITCLIIAESRFMARIALRENRGQCINGEGAAGFQAATCTLCVIIFMKKLTHYQMMFS